MTSAADRVLASIVSYGGADIVPRIGGLYKNIENQISRYLDEYDYELWRWLRTWAVAVK